jgi:hypothetical protein
MECAYFCNMTLDLAQRSGLNPISVIKTSAILNDVVFFDRGIHPLTAGLEYSVTEMLAGWAEPLADERNRLVSDRRFSDIFQSSEEVLPLSSRIWSLSDENSAFAEELRPKIVSRANDLGASFFGGAPINLMSDSNGGPWKNIPNFVANDLLNFRIAKEKQPELSAIFSPMHFLAQDSGNGLQSKLEGASFKLSGARNSRFPDFGVLSWPEIFELRSDPSVISFRKKIKEIRDLNGVHNFTDEILTETYFKDLEDAFCKRRPKPLRAFLRGLVGNWPIVPLNPAGWLFAVADFQSELRDFKDLNWMHFVSEAKKMVAQGGEKNSLNRE